MNLADAKRRALILMREFTVDGSVSESPDYAKSMDDLANAAQNEIARKQRIPATVTLASGVVDGDYTVYAMPSDFDGKRAVVYTPTGGRPIINPLIAFEWRSRTSVAVKTTYVGAWKVYYYRRPTQIVYNSVNDKANDAYEFQIDPEGQELIPLYMAASLLVDEDGGRSVNLMNQYYARLDRLQTHDIPLPFETIRNVTGW